MKSKNIPVTGNPNPASHTRSDSTNEPQSVPAQKPRSESLAKPDTKSPRPHKPKPVTKIDAGRQYVNPVDYTRHAWPSMQRFAGLLSLRHECTRTMHAYYRGMRLIHEYCDCDPALITEPQMRDYFLYVRNVKKWKPQTIRQSVATSKVFFVEMLGHDDWTVFSQIKTKDHATLPVVLTREEVIALLEKIQLRRYLIPLKLIYCCGLRLSECLGLTRHDVKGDDQKLYIRQSKNNKDRMVPIGLEMLEDLRRYWKVHRNPLLLFPHTGRGSNARDAVAARMHAATRPMPYSSLGRLLLKARAELNIPRASPHALRHSFATHFLEAEGNIHSLQKVLGHSNIETTMAYLHVTHLSEGNALALINKLSSGLPR